MAVAVRMAVSVPTLSGIVIVIVIIVVVVVVAVAAEFPDQKKEANAKQEATSDRLCVYMFDCEYAVK